MQPILAENMCSQVNPYGYNTMLLKEIIDYRKHDSAVPLEDKYLTTRSGQRRIRKTTQEWELLVAWKDGTKSWVRLATLKDSYPVELAEFAKARRIENEPAFAWWVPNALRRRNAILSAVKARFQNKTHKFGIELPTSINHARELDRVNRNNLWMDALQKEMFNIGIAFEALEDGASAPNGVEQGVVFQVQLLGRQQITTSIVRVCWYPIPVATQMEWIVRAQETFHIKHQYYSSERIILSPRT
jgi:hypothetical protein